MLVRSFCKSSLFTSPYVGRGYTSVFTRSNVSLADNQKAAKSIIFTIKQKKIKEAEEMFQSVTDKNKIPVNVYNAFMHEYIKQNESEKAYQYWNVMKKSGVAPDLTSYLTVIRDLGKRGDFNKIRILMEEIYERGLKPNTKIFSAIIHGLLKHDKVPQALRALEEMKIKNIEREVFSYAPFIDYYCRKGEFDEARKYLEIMKQENIKPINGIYGSFINGYTYHGKHDLVNEIFVEMREHDLSPDIVSYTVLLRTLFQQKNVSEALSVIDRIKKSKIGFTEKAYDTIIFGCILCGELDLFRKFSKEAKSKGFKVKRSFHKDEMME